MDLIGLEKLITFADELTRGDIKELQVVMGIPMGICDDDIDEVNFLFSMRNWEEFNPYSFYQAMHAIGRPGLISIALAIPWLCVSEPTQQTKQTEQTEQLSMKTFLTMLRTEISKKQWRLIGLATMNILEGKDFESIITLLLEVNLITNNLRSFKRILKAINRMDLVYKIQEYSGIFLRMSEDEFVGKVKRELAVQAIEIAQWETKLKTYLENQYNRVSQMLGNDEPVSLKHVYVELTIVREEPRAVNLEDETTYNDLAYLRKIANNEIDIQPVDFTEELKLHDSYMPEIWCLIGNPGCGKTFLSKWIALRFSNYEITNVSYSIAIPCRNTDWHKLESTYMEEDKPITPEFVQEWLCIGLPVTVEWSKEMAKHLVKSDGEGLLLIIDGLDEFIKKVPFVKTFLYMLLSRQTLSRSNIILTTRPGAWTDISSNHELKVNRYYHVLGFSPSNRDMYFSKQIVNEHRLDECKRLLARYDEMNLLSLIPVNASLFAALFKDESVTIQTLTQLYDELTCYLIKRQLCRMGLREFANVTNITYFHPDVQNCLHSIGLIALVGVYKRELISTEKLPLIINQVETESYYLGLAHEYHKRETVGIITKVWGFAHLTMQEFTSAIFLKSTSWTDQCLSVRYIADSDENFFLFRMVVRFLCGLLTDRSAAILTILFVKLTPHTVSNLPLCYQLEYLKGFTSSQSLIKNTNWYEFTNKYIQLIPLLFETNSKLITTCLKIFLQNSFSIYLNNEVRTISSNEWICFLQSLELVNHIQVIYVDTFSVNRNQFKSLLENIVNFHLSYLAIEFFNKSSTEILSYISLFEDIELKTETRVSIELHSCNLTDVSAVNLFSPTDNIKMSGMQLSFNKYSSNFIKQLVSNKLTALQYLHLENDHFEYKSILPALHNATLLRGLYLYNIPNKYHQKVMHAISKLDELQEISFDTYSFLPHIISLSRISYLEITSIRKENIIVSDYLVQVINKNNNTFRVLNLEGLEYIGFKSWNGFLIALRSCVNLVRIELRKINEELDDVTKWSTTLSKLKSLVHLEFYFVRLFDTGLLSVCEGLIGHPTIKYLCIYNSGQTSNSCEVLINLIHTVSHLHLEFMEINLLSKPDPEPVNMLNKIAEEFNIQGQWD